MYQISDMFIDKIMSCNWLSNCGNHDNIVLDFNVTVAKSKKEAVRSIATIAWENKCLDAAGDLSVYLVKNRLDRQFDWNAECEKIKEKYMVYIYTKLIDAAKKQDLPGETIAVDVRFNVMNLFKYDLYYETGFRSDFFEKMLQIYIAGYLPCGYLKNSKENMFLIY